MRKNWIFILLLCVGLSAAALTGCSLKDSDSKNKELADRFLTEFFTINSDGRNDELMTNLQNNSELFTDGAVLNDALKEYYSGVSEYLTDECLDQLITAEVSVTVSLQSVPCRRRMTMPVTDLLS